MIDVSFVADVICQGGRWNGLPGWVMLWSDVITIVADGVASVYCSISALVLGCCTEPHPICGADGTCLCSCSGMDY